jgi:hypothetical protein
MSAVHVADCGTFALLDSEAHRRASLLPWTFPLMEQICKAVAVIHSLGKTHLPEVKTKKEGYYMLGFGYFLPFWFSVKL